MQTPASLREKIIIALDVADADAARRLTEKLSGAATFYKIGLQLFTREGPQIVRQVQETGARVFLDLKFHDIPNTVEHAVRSACALQVQMLSVHLCGGPAMLRAAVAGAAATGTLLLGITVLTSMNRETLQEAGVSGPVEDQVLRLSRTGVENGFGGIVASPQEVSLLRQIYSEKLTIVTPGVRPSWASADDQQRTMTPAAALAAGADYLVVGRPITAHSNPPEALERLFEEATA